MRTRFRRHFEPFGRYESPTPKRAVERDLASEIMAALRERGPLGKAETARVIRARKSDVLHTMDDLAEAGELFERDGLWAVRGHTHVRRPATQMILPGVRLMPPEHHLRTPRASLERVRQIDDIGLDPCAAPRNTARVHLAWHGRQTPTSSRRCRSWP